MNEISEVPLPEQQKAANERAFLRDKERGFFDGWNPAVVAYYNGKYWGSHVNEEILKEGLKRKRIPVTKCYIISVG